MAKGSTNRKKTTVDPNETKAQKFVRIGQVRVGKAIKAIQNVAALGGRSYESTPAQHAKISTLIRGAHDDMLAKLAGTSSTGGPKVEL